ncbi:Uncharacterised protein [Legionella jordanis]|nr:Uncharacterised protein [Legionella jordanis]
MLKQREFLLQVAELVGEKQAVIGERINSNAN